MGQVAEEWGEPLARVYDAFSAAKFYRFSTLGSSDQPPYTPFSPDDDPWVDAYALAHDGNLPISTS